MKFDGDHWPSPGYATRGSDIIHNSITAIYKILFVFRSSNEVWTFYLMYWTGNRKFDGEPYCCVCDISRCCWSYIRSLIFCCSRRSFCRPSMPRPMRSISFSDLSPCNAMNSGARRALTEGSNDHDCCLWNSGAPSTLFWINPMRKPAECTEGGWRTTSSWKDWIA